MNYTTDLSNEDIREFQNTIYDYYRDNPRILSWRETGNPYNILVSEIMLQQTQVERVISKYNRFIDVFPDFETLAGASFQDVLHVWQGLGYNRRALAVLKAAQKTMADFDGVLPSDPSLLRQFPGIGPYTACAIAAFAFNKAEVFIETNIRSVYIHFFFEDSHTIHDREILPLVEKTLDKNNPRRWYSALMDYGVMLKKTHVNPSRKSVHHHIQSPFKGSDRQIRGKIIRLFTEKTPVNEKDIVERLGDDTKKIHTILNQLEDEKFIILNNGMVSLYDQKT